MLQRGRDIFERVAAALPGWMFLVAGMTLLTLTLVVPLWEQHRHLAWQRDLMRQQAAAMDRQTERYAAFHEALRADDPVLLERLAYTQLRLKPVNKQPLEAPGVDPVAEGRSALAAGRQHEPAALTAAVDAWLAEPIPEPGQDVPPPRAINSRLTRLTRGPTQFVLIGVALACIAGGLWWNPRPDVGDDDDAPAGDGHAAARVMPQGQSAAGSPPSAAATSRACSRHISSPPRKS